ncbi:DUF4236 domain-containing protein [Noviherbaspirillum autotrophicum]|uniref:DUF4236 domain-containing protein n=1 Tax=Noviherbaspirillum autotrophicum TaxID=709839 RepID=A0A0C1YR20_9BURK|nr:DUF4236 domain-containing protein [Noviherbaspirillum autotrophicum]KIF83052.1 hypothetical protein TSA66_22995 [Noviherbaspirillum autotrophicum]
MGFYLRKSVSVGPFRFNFSKSGVGVSTGFKGFRVGTGPRGNYISVGRGGLYYRATLPASSSQPSVPSTPRYQPPMPEAQPGVGPMVAIESAPVSAMQDTSSADLLNELNGKAKRPNYWKWTAGASLVALWLIPSTAPSWLTPFAAILLTGLTAYIGVRDTVAKTAVLCYELDQANEQAFEKLHEAFRALSSCRKTWRVDARAAVHDSKYHAGAGALVQRKDAQFGKGLPPKVKSNLEVPFVKAGPMSLYFMPDRVLVYSSSGVGTVTYKDLRFEGMSRQFIESESVPSDATVVGHTWKYVNKKGGPDKRFKDNKQLPIALYEEISFKSASGLNEVYQLSKHSLIDAVKDSLKTMERVLPA